jgi:lipopolysaccharide export LptBFGC system permease protein LptF
VKTRRCFISPMSRAIVGKYILGQTVPWLLIGIFGASFVFLATQLVRIAPLFAGAGVGATAAVEAVLLLLVPVLGWALAPAFLVALFAVAGKMSAAGELGALDALGIPRHHRVVPSVLFALFLSLISAWIWLDGAPKASGRVFAVALELAESALVGRISEKRIHAPLPGLTFYAEKQRDRLHFETVFVAHAEPSGPQKQVVAKRATLERSGRGILSIRFEEGHLFILHRAAGDAGSRGENPNTAVTFDKLTIRLPISAAVQSRLDFIPSHLLSDTPTLLGPPPQNINPASWRFTLWRRVAAPVGFLALSLAGIFIAFGSDWKNRGRAVLMAAILFAVYQVAGRAGESLLLAGVLIPPFAAFLPVITVILFSLGFTLIRRCLRHRYS